MARFVGKSTINKKDIFKTENLPVPSQSLMQIIALLQEKDINFSHLIDTVSRDQVLVARMLKLINSSFYSLKNKIDSVTSAVSLLGISNIKQIIYASFCFNFFSKEEQEEWDHAYSTSLLISRLVKEYKIPVAANMQLTALMHDIGKVVFRRKYPKAYPELIRVARNHWNPVFSKERELLHCDHSDIGAWLLEAWDMPEDTITPVFFHHMERQPRLYALETLLLKISDWVDNAARDQMMQCPSFGNLEAFGLTEDSKDDLVNSQAETIASVKDDIVEKQVA